MSERTDTPETDMAEHWIGWKPGGLVSADFARSLERERNQLRQWTSVNGVLQLQQQLDEARSQLAAAQEQNTLRETPNKLA